MFAVYCYKYKYNTTTEVSYAWIKTYALYVKGMQERRLQRNINKVIVSLIVDAKVQRGR